MLPMAEPSTCGCLASSGGRCQPSTHWENTCDGTGPSPEALIYCQYLQKCQNMDLEKAMLSILVSKGEPVELTTAMCSLDR